MNERCGYACATVGPWSAALGAREMERAYSV